MPPSPSRRSIRYRSLIVDPMSERAPLGRSVFPREPPSWAVGGDDARGGNGVPARGARGFSSAGPPIRSALVRKNTPRGNPEIVGLYPSTFAAGRALESDAP